MSLNTLTKGEEKIMRILWQLNKGFINDLLQEMPHDKPAYNTVSTVIRRLEKKGYVGHTAYGRNYQYYPIVSIERYKEFITNNLINEFFGNSVSEFISFILQKEDFKSSEILAINRAIQNGAR